MSEPMPGTGRLSRVALLILRNSAVPLLVLALLGGGLFVAGQTLSDPTPRAGEAVDADRLSPEDPVTGKAAEEAEAERRCRFLRVVGGWLFGVSLALLLRLPWVALWFQVKLASERALPTQAVPRPEFPNTDGGGEDELAKAVAGFLALGFESSGWHSLGDFEGTVLGCWQHREHAARGFILYFPDAGTVRVRFARRYQSGAMLVSSTRFADHAYDLPPGLFLQRMKGSVAELWKWHRAAEAMFPTRLGESEPPPLSPIDLHHAFRQRVARFHRTYTLWVLRYELLCELTRAWRLSGVSVQQQLERGWIPDPALYQGDGDEGE